MDAPAVRSSSPRSFVRPRVALVLLIAAVIGTLATLYGGYLNRHGGRAAEAKILLGWVLALAGGALVMAAQLATVRRPRPDQSGKPVNVDPPGWVAQVVRPSVGLLSVGASLIHFAVIGEHYDEDVLAGLFFVGLSIFQLVWALGVVIRPRRWLLAAGIAVNLAAIVIWAVSRTVGLPFGPESGEAIEVGFGDTVSTAFEVLIVFGALILWRAGQAAGSVRRGLRLPTASGATGFLALVIAAVTALGLISAVGGSIFIPASG
jgi:hypothetical protein